MEIPAEENGPGPHVYRLIGEEKLTEAALMNALGKAEAGVVDSEVYRPFAQVLRIHLGVKS